MRVDEEEVLASPYTRVQVAHPFFPSLHVTVRTPVQRAVQMLWQLTKVLDVPGLYTWYKQKCVRVKPGRSTSRKLSRKQDFSFFSLAFYSEQNHLTLKTFLETESCPLHYEKQTSQKRSLQ